MKIYLRKSLRWVVLSFLIFWRDYRASNPILGNTCRGVSHSIFELSFIIFHRTVPSENVLKFFKGCVSALISTAWGTWVVARVLLFTQGARDNLVVLRCQSNTNRTRVALKIFDRTKIACTQTFRLNWSRNRRGNEWHAPSDFVYSKRENTRPSCILGKPSSLKNRTTMRPRRILPKWFSGISQVWFSGFLARCLINSFHFPIVKADWNRCITCLWIIAIQLWIVIDAVHTCCFYMILEMWDKIGLLIMVISFIWKTVYSILRITYIRGA